MFRKSFSSQNKAAGGKWPVYGDLPSIVMIGMGSIGRATMPLIERHFNYDPKKLSVIEPCPLNLHLIKDRGYNVIHDGLTTTNYREMLDAKYLDGQSLQTIATSRGTSIDSVKSMLRRARAAFRTTFKTLADPQTPS